MSWEQGLFLFVTKGSLSAALFGLLFLVFARGLFRSGIGVQPSSSRPLFLGYAIVVAVSLLLSLAVFWVEWHKPECGIACRYFFPPYSHYYFNEVIVRWTSTFAFNACAGLIAGLIFSLFARATSERIIDQLDVDLLTVGGMVAGWPNVLIFYAIVFALTIVLTIARALLHRSVHVRMIITPVLPFAAAFVALFGNQVARVVRLYEIGLTLV